MPYTPNSNSGSLWREAKEKISNKTGKPYRYYSGSCIIDGKEYWINAFLNTVKVNGEDKEVYNMSFNPKETKPEPLKDENGTVIPF